MTHPLIKFVTSVCVQAAVYWEIGANDGFGRFTYVAAREIKCRWDEKINMIVGADGEQVVSKAEVLVIEDLKEGSFLWLGSLDTIDPFLVGKPEEASGAQRILSVSKTPLFRSATEFVRKVYL